MMPPEVPEISLDEAKERLDVGGTIFIDMRDIDSYNEAHIPDALHLTNENVKAFMNETSKDQPIIVYCYHGNTSKGGTAFLKEQGYQHVHSMSGGFEAWRLLYDYDDGDEF